jgi:hypothetical protein
MDVSGDDIETLPGEEIHNCAAIKVEIASSDRIGVHWLRSIAFEPSAKLKSQCVETTHLCLMHSHTCYSFHV